MRITKGATRTVLLIHRWAVKIPCVVEWRLFLQGLLANMQERLFWTTKDQRLCPVLFSFPGGFINVMARASPLSEKEWCTFDYHSFVNSDDMIVPAEKKISSFGWLGGRVVAVDYG